MSLKLYTSPQSQDAAKALIAAQFNGVTIEINVGADTKSPEFLAKNPTGSLPTLETESGVIFESNAIARYVVRLNDSAKLYGRSPFEASSIDSWLDFANTEIRGPSNDIVPGLLGLSGYNKPAAEAAKAKLHKVLATLDGYLLSRTFLVGETLSLADIVVAVQLVPLFRLVFDPQFRQPFTNVVRWFLTCVNQPQFKSVMGEVKLAEVAAQPQKQEKKKEDKPKETPMEQKPKEEKPKKEKPKKEEEEEDDGLLDEEKPEKKKPNPLDSLPPSPFNIDEYKRVYSNNDTRTVALPKFFETFDNQGWSVWKCAFKYQSELDKLLISVNKVGGFFQRLEPDCRKYSFASFVITGDEYHQFIYGCWVFRGQEVIDLMKECEDCVLYDWTKLNLSNSQDKKFVEDLFAQDAPIDGHPFIQGKNYK